jgi:hypothetical protein
MQNKLRLRKRRHSETVLVQNCEVFMLTLSFDSEMQKACCSCKTEMVFAMGHAGHYFKYVDKLYICGSLIVKQVNVLYLVTYLFSSASGEMDQTYQS